MAATTTIEERRAAAPAAAPHAPRPALAVGLLGALCIAFSAILVRESGASPTTAALHRCLWALPILYPLALRERRKLGPRPRGAWRWPALAGIFLGADLVFWHRAIEAVGAGLSTVLANVQVVVVGLVAWLLLGERPARASIAAVPVVLGGVVLISGLVGGGAYGTDPPLGVLLGFLTACAYSAFLLTMRHANADVRRPAAPLADATAVAAVTAAVIGVALGDLSWLPALPRLGWLVLLAVTSQVVGWLLISYALPRLPALSTSLVLTVQPVGTLFLGAVLLSESPSAVQLAGVGLIVVGLMVATVGSARAPTRVRPGSRGSAATRPRTGRRSTRTSG